MMLRRNGTSLIRLGRTRSVPCGAALSRDRSERGDTLIEVLLALLILSFATVALLLAFSTTISASSTHRNVAAANVALESIEQQAQSQISSQLTLFSCPSTLS